MMNEISSSSNVYSIATYVKRKQTSSWMNCYNRSDGEFRISDEKIFRGDQNQFSRGNDETISADGSPNKSLEGTKQ
jgi:hypothetical protein